MAIDRPPLWQRHDWRRFVRHDAHRFFTPAGLAEQKRAEEAEHVAQRRSNERAAAAEQEALAAEVRGMRTLVDHLKSYLAWRRAAERSAIWSPHADSALRRFNLAYARYFGEDKAGFNPNQPRVSAGNPDGGQWVGAFTLPGQPRQQDEKPSPPMVVAQAGFGMLVAEIPVPGGRRCVYNFGVLSIAVPGAANFRCTPTAHWSGLTHGTILNDNRR